MDIPDLGDGIEDAKQTTKNLIRWLPTPFQCKDCGTYCRESTTWDPHMVEYTESWKCPDCGRHFRRE